MEELKKFYTEVFCKVNKELFAKSEAIIREYLQKLPKERCDIDYDNYPCCVSYDGGPHPEYMATPFSTVLSVYIKNNGIYLDIEDDEGYPIEEVSADELFCVADALVNTINDNYEFEDEE